MNAIKRTTDSLKKGGHQVTALEGDKDLIDNLERSDIPPTLEKKGFAIKVRDPYSFYMGCVQLVCRERNIFTGVAGLRRDGSAEGPRT